MTVALVHVKSFGSVTKNYISFKIIILDTKAAPVQQHGPGFSIVSVMWPGIVGARS